MQFLTRASLQQVEANGSKLIFLWGQRKRGGGGLEIKGITNEENRLAFGYFCAIFVFNILKFFMNYFTPRS